MSHLIRSSRTLATSILVAGGGSFLAAQTTTAVLINRAIKNLGLTPVKGPDLTGVPVNASVEGHDGEDIQDWPRLDFRDPTAIEKIQLDRDEVLVLGAGDTKGETVKVSFNLAAMVPGVVGGTPAGVIEYTACTPLDRKSAPFCSLALTPDSQLAKDFEIVPLDRKDVRAWQFEGKDYSFFTLRWKVGDDGVRRLSRGDASRERKDSVADRAVPGLSVTDPGKVVSAIKTKLEHALEDQPAPAKQIPALPLNPDSKFKPLTANLWPDKGPSTLSPAGTPVVLHTLTFQPGELPVGTLVTGDAFVRTKGVTTGTALIGIRFDCADGKSYFGSRMDSKVPTESHSTDRVRVGVWAKAPANVTRVTLSIQTRGLNPGAEATFDSVVFRRFGHEVR